LAGVFQQLQRSPKDGELPVTVTGRTQGPAEEVARDHEARNA
jgi:hypothetical protein